MGNQSSNVSYPNVLADILQRHTGRGGEVRVEDLANAAGVDAKLLYQIRQGAYTPSFNMAMRIICALPEAAAAEFLAAAGFHSAVRTDAVGGSFYEAHYELTRTGAFYGEALRDGLLDHKEQRDLATKFLPRLMAAAARCVRPRA